MESSALGALERALAGMTGKEQFDALAGSRQLWWRYCEHATRLPADRPEARQLIKRLAETYDPAEDDGRAFLKAADVLAGIADAVSGEVVADSQRENLAKAIGYWNETGLLPRGVAGTADIPDGRLQAVAATLDELPGGPGRAMVALVALLLADPQARLRRRVVVPVLFDRPRQGGGLSGRLEIGELPAGPAGVYPDPRMMSFTRASDAEFAGGLTRALDYARAATKPRGRDRGRCIVWRLIYDSRHEQVSLIAGGSLGAAFAIALKEILAYPASQRPSRTWLRAKFRGLRPRCAVTGIIADDRTLDAVGGIASKLEAAEARNWRLVAPGRNQAAGIHIPAGVRVYWAADLPQADRFARRWRPVRTGLAAGLLAAGLTATALVAYSSSVASSARQAADRQRDITVSGEVAAKSEAQGDINPILAKLESLAAWRISPTGQARDAMLDAAALPGIAELPSSSGPVWSVAFSPDGKVLATGDDDGTVRIWNTATHRQSGQPLSIGDPVESVAFSPDGTILATGGDDGTVQFWNTATHRPSGQSLDARDTVTAMAFSPDGATLAIVTVDGTTRLWDVKAHTGHLLTAPASAVTSVAFSPDSKILATGSDDGTARLWNVASRRQEARPFHLGPNNLVNAVAFSPDGTTLATGSDDGTVRLWNVATRHQIGPSFGSHSSVHAVAFSPDGTILATGGSDGTARLWSVASHHEVGQPLTPGPASTINAVAFNTGGTILATGSTDGTARLWNVADYQVGRPHPGDTSLSIESVAFTPDSKTLITASDTDNVVRLWHVATRQQSGQPITLPPGKRTDSLAVSPHGNILATGSHDGTVRLWDIATRRQVGPQIGLGPGNPVVALAFSPDGKTVATGSDDGTARLWNVANGRQVGRPLGGPSDYAVNAVAFSPDGTTLAGGTANRTVLLWSVATHRQVGRPLPAGPEAIESVAFSPDGTTLAAGSYDGSVRLWNVATHHQAGQALTAGTKNIRTEAFSPDSKFLATGSYDGSVRLWDIATHHQIGRPLIGDSISVASVAFSPDGTTLVGGETSEVTNIWDVAFLASPQPFLCAQVKRPLTRPEWKADVPHGPAYQVVCP